MVWSGERSIEGVCGFRFLGLPLPPPPRLLKKGPFFDDEEEEEAEAKSFRFVGHRSGRVDKLPLRFYFKIQIKISKFK